MLAAGMVLNNRYQLNERVAAGGMGEVWRGTDVLLHRGVAIKVLLPTLMSDAEFIKRFRTEARLMASLRHPGIVQVYDYGEDAVVEGVRMDYLVMEYVEGTPLSRRIQTAGKLGVAETMGIVSQAADALQVAHEAGIVHRDVKPSNLLVRPGGAVVLVDFGVARSVGVTGITSTNVVLGSAHYMAPEQAEGKPVSPVTDVYALGAVAYCCLTGRPPYEGDNPLHVLSQLVLGEPPTLPLNIPAAASTLVLRALDKEPARRFPSAAAMADAARSAQNTVAVQAMPSPRTTRMPARPNGGPSVGPATRAGGGAASGSTAHGGSGFGSSAHGGGGAASGRSGRGGGGAGFGSSAHGGGGFGPAGGGAAFGAPGRLDGGVSHGSPAGDGPGYGTASGPGRGVAYAGGRGGRRNAILVLVAAAVVIAVAGVALGLAFRPGAGEAQIPPGGGGAPQLGAAGPGNTRGQGNARQLQPGGVVPSRTAGEGRSHPTTGPASAGPGATVAPSGSPAKPAGGANPYTPKQVCGLGFAVIDQAALRDSGGVVRGRVYLLYNSVTGKNCTATIKATDLGIASAASAYLEVQGGGRSTDSGSFEYYAGPVRAKAAGVCVKWGGAVGGVSYDSPFEHCS